MAHAVHEGGKYAQLAYQMCPKFREPNSVAGRGTNVA